MVVRRSRNRGLSVAEILIATAILAVLLVAVLGLFAQLLASTTKNSHLQTGTYFADRVLNQAIREARPTAPAFDAYVEGQEGIYTHDQAAATIFYHRLKATRLTPVDVPGESWYLEVEVSWWQADSSDPTRARPGSGKLFTRQGRMVYLSR